MRKWKKYTFIFVFFIIVSIFSSGQLVQAEVNTQEITSLEEPTWVFKTGMTRAKFHDRQDLGVVLNQGATLRIRKKSTNDGYSNLAFWLLGNNGNEEKSFTLTNEWQTITVEYATVPFVTTPYGSKNAEIEYEIEGSTTDLPIYTKDTDEQSFFNEWGSTKAAFGLIKGSKFQLLIPFKEKDQAQAHKAFANLNEYLDYQDSIIKYYDEMMGLSADSGALNKLPENRFFLKADASAKPGVAAYYGVNYAANGYSTVVDMWMSKWDWATLHEIGHAYQPSYTNKGMYTGEVSNNLLAVYFTYQHRGKIDADKYSWLFNYGKKTTVESELYDKLVNQHIGYPDLEHRQRLILLTALTQAAGKDNWTKMNIMYRELMNQGDATIKNMSLPDLFTMYYSQQTHQDFSPVFAKWGLDLMETRQPEINRGNGYSALASLVDVVPQSQLAQAVATLSDQFSLVDSQFNLVTNQQLSQLQLPGGSLTIHHQIDDFEQLKGKTMLLKNGTQVVKEVVITAPDIEISDLPNGIYTVSYPTTTQLFSIDNYYAYVRDAQNEMTVHFTPLEGSRLLDSTIYFKGIGDYTFAVLDTDFTNQAMKFTILRTTPHDYYSGELYASIEVLDETGTSIFKKDIEGTNVTTETNSIPLREGYQIVIYHAETKGRLSASDDQLIDKTVTTNHLQVQNGALVNQNGLPGTVASVTKIQAAIDQLLADTELGKLTTSSEKNHILVAILSLPEAARDQFLIDYQDLLGISPGAITVHYVDEKGIAIEQPNVYQGRFGTIFEAQAKEISGYELVSEETTLSVDYQLEAQAVTFVYKRQTSSSETETSTTKTSDTNEETTTTTTNSEETNNESTTSMDGNENDSNSVTETTTTNDKSTTIETKESKTETSTTTIDRDLLESTTINKGDDNKPAKITTEAAESNNRRTTDETVEGINNNYEVNVDINSSHLVEENIAENRQTDNMIAQTSNSSFIAESRTTGSTSISTSQQTSLQETSNQTTNIKENDQRKQAQPTTGSRKGRLTGALIIGVLLFFLAAYLILKNKASNS
jgi:hypothetical protein